MGQGNKAKKRKGNDAPHQEKETPSWKSFEQFVAALQLFYAPTGARVKHNDSEIDKRTQEPRQIDATVRYGGWLKKNLIAIECRERFGGRQDVMWVDHIVGKSYGINARWIAVSATGFTRAAEKVAAHHNIEIYTLAEVDSVLAASWIQVPGLEWEDNDWTLDDASIGMTDFPGQRATQIAQLDVPLFRQADTGTWFTPLQLVHYLSNNRDIDFWHPIPVDGRRHRHRVGFTVSNHIDIALDEGQFRINSIDLNLSVRRTKGLQQLRYYEYRDSNGTLLRVGRAKDVTAPGLHFNLVQDAQTGEIRVISEDYRKASGT
ncbi:MAG TPA: hypothetical protein VK934_09530 [Fimbriimonas sp.]|nr:hypothetical protein [Fimbriimonas sp.]